MLIKINKMKSRKGFTLVELLLVVAILAVLAFLAVPAIASTIRNARLRTCASNEIMIENAIYRWYADQVAAGRSLVFTDATFGDQMPLTDWISAAEGLATGTSELLTYFTPMSRTPRCPIDNTDHYEVITEFDADGGLEGVEVICEQGHDRLREVEAET